MVAICYHVLARMQPPGSSWRLLGLSGVELYIHCTHWALLEVSGNSWRGYWRLLEAAGASEGFWRLLEASGGAIGGSWRILETPGGSWRLLEASGSQSVQIQQSGLPGRPDPVLEASGGFWGLLEAPGGAIGGSWRLLEAPGGSWKLPGWRASRLIHQTPQGHKSSRQASGGFWRPLEASGMAVKPKSLKKHWNLKPN